MPSLRVLSLDVSWVDGAQLYCDCAKVPLCGVLPTSHRMLILFLGRKSELPSGNWVRSSAQWFMWSEAP